MPNDALGLTPEAADARSDSALAKREAVAAETAVTNDAAARAYPAVPVEHRRTDAVAADDDVTASVTNGAADAADPSVLIQKDADGDVTATVTNDAADAAEPSVLIKKDADGDVTATVTNGAVAHADPAAPVERRGAVAVGGDGIDAITHANSAAPRGKRESVAVARSGDKTNLVATPRADLPALFSGSVILRGVRVQLDSDVGEAFIRDCARHIEGLLSDSELKFKHELSDQDWEGLARNAGLLRAVRAEHERRIATGEAAREAALRHYVGSPAVLNEILTNDLVSPHTRIAAAAELRQVACSEPVPVSRHKILIVIDLGGDRGKIVLNNEPSAVPAPSDVGGPP
jgi:hypothetical protein